MITRTLHLIACFVHLCTALILSFYAQNRIWLILNEYLTFLSHAIGVVIWSDQNNQNKKVSEYTRRWLEYAITAGLLEIAILDTTNVPKILSILTLNAVLQLFGWILDHEKNFKYLLLMGFILLGVEITLVSYWSSEPARTIVVYGILYSLFGVVQTLHKFDMLPYDENNVYTLLSITTKTVLTWTLVSHDWNDETLEWAISISFAVMLLISLAVLYEDPGRRLRKL